MKTYAPPVIGKVKRSRGILGFIRSDFADIRHYFAENRSENVRAMWIEAYQLGSAVSYPCLLDVNGDIMKYHSATGITPAERAENKRLMSAWKAFMYGEGFKDFECSELSPSDFSEKLKNYR